MRNNGWGVLMFVVFSNFLSTCLCNTFLEMQVSVSQNSAAVSVSRGRNQKCKRELLNWNLARIAAKSGDRIREKDSKLRKKGNLRKKKLLRPMSLHYASQMLLMSLTCGR